MDNSFDRIVDKAKEFADVIGKKTDEIVTVSKLKVKRTNISGQIRDAQNKLGAALYESKAYSKNNDEIISLIISEIDSLNAELQDIEAQISQATKTVRCNTCGTVNPKEAYYCQHCGSSVEKPVYQYSNNNQESSSESYTQTPTQTYSSNNNSNVSDTAPIIDDQNNDSSL